MEARPDGMNYAAEKFSNAVRILATSPADMKERLRKAAIEITPVSAADFPGSLRPDFEWIRQKLTARPKVLPGEGSLKSTLVGMHRRTAGKIAERIYDLNYALENWDESQSS